MAVAKLVLTLAEAAEEVGVSPVLFLEMVRDRWMPLPLDRVGAEPVWSKARVLAALDRESTPARPYTTGRIYVAGFSSYVKIGFSRNVVGRIRALEFGLPERLHVHAIHDGCFRDEGNLFRRFAEHRLHGEWFSKAPAIEAWIAEGCPLVSTERKTTLFKPHKSRRG